VRGADGPEPHGVAGAGAGERVTSPATDAVLQRVSALPTDPGVYLFRDAAGGVIYVGKAANLRSRVRSYFGLGGDGRYQIHFLVERIRDVEVIVTANVKEALLLENQLIKKHKPRFNVRLRDDKNYLALRIDPRESHPRFTETRGFKRDGALHFGPYTSSTSLRETLNQLQKIFPLRTCSDNVLKSYRRRGRPCIEHSVGRCAAPCVDLIDDEAYAELVHGAVLFMRGKAGDVVRELRERMALASSDERFEDAARLRDRIGAIEQTVESQAMISARFLDRDVFGLAREGAQLEIQSLHVRRGKLLGGNSHRFRDVRIDDSEALGSFLGQYYGEDRELPHEVLLPLAVEDSETLEELWRERAGRVVRVLVPQRGEGRRLLEMATRNARLAQLERARSEESVEAAARAVQELLRLPAPPRRIECYDVSHLQGSMHVASRVLFQDTKPAKDGYRRYKLREAAPGDDYGAMREILTRRFARLEEEPAPDLLLLDGGKGQLSVALAVARDLDIEPPPMAAIAKERDDGVESRDGAGSGRVLRHGGTKRERLFLPGVKDPVQPPGDHVGLLLLQRVRDESHRFAIRYHRELQRKLGMHSILDELPGIGPVKRRVLLRGLGSLQRVKRASVEELAALPKISRADAERICRFFAAASEDGTVKGASPQADEAGGEGAEPTGEECPDHPSSSERDC
jgi:excinuclease ABC subunit C